MFCVEYGISRKSFYELRKRARADGQAAVLEPRSRRPKSSPAKLTDQVEQQAIAVRAALESSGLDHGPISARRAFEHVLVVQDEDQITVVDLNGEVLLETTRPAPGTTYVGRATQNPKPSPKS